MWIPAARVRWIQGRCAVLASVGLVACLVLAAAIVGFGRALPTAYHPINTMVWGAGAASVIGPFLSSISLGMARSYAWGEQFDVFRMWQARRALTGSWVSSSLFVPLSWFLLVMTARSGEKPVGLTGGTWAYLLLLAAPAALAGVLTYVGRALLPTPG
ncbi:hypothetical protein LZG04_34235 [Saccharothrix sp. S26]|uniref:hypothetical protein n=1 Tax=Saccharothrix sp. S26 TaxID=2907215 RepID=UPI001F17F729|nr:hypothetical protein [Saccharothrix sp. S26]MCE6999836.1 hypothetical protein [Saccharothrix sp. S26]